MRIVHILHAFGTGGLEKGIATVIRHARPEFQHVVLCLDRSGESARLLPPSTDVIEMRKPPGNSPRFLWKLSRKIRALQPDVVHTRNWGGIDGIIAARLAGLRHVVHGEHGWDVEDPDGAKPRRVRVRRFVARWVREYTCVSRQMQQWLRDTIGVPSRVTQIYNGVDAELYRPAKDGKEARDALGIPGGAFVIGIIGRLDPIKNHPVLFEAFRRVRVAVPTAGLLVVGDGPERERLEAQAGDGVRFLGNRADVPEILRCLDVFVLPSRNEGISNTILEAMASGVPVVASGVGGNPELVEEGVTGTLCPPGDASAIEKAFRRYAARPDLARSHGAAGRLRATREFNVRAMTRSYEEVWTRLTGRPHA